MAFVFETFRPFIKNEEGPSKTKNGSLSIFNTSSLFIVLQIYTTLHLLGLVTDIGCINI